MKKNFSLFIHLCIFLSTLAFVSQSVSAAPPPYVVDYIGGNNLSASSDSTVVPGNTGVASQKFVVSASGWNGAFFTDWGSHDLSAYSTLDFWVKGGSGGEALSINVGDGTNNYSKNIQTPSDGSWQNVSIEMSAMVGVDFTKWRTITFSTTGAVNTTFYINNVQFSFVDPYTGPQVTVLPWNGFESAVSLTFDDAADSHLDIAVPALNAKDMDATFFIISEPALTGGRKDEWKNITLNGHELGNHSKHHYEPSAAPDPSNPNKKTFDDTLGYDETIGAQDAIELEMGIKTSSYAYPYTNNDPFMVKYLRDTHVSARGGGWGNMKASSTPDWLNIPCQFTGTTGTFENDYKTWIDDAIAQKAWIVFGIHDVGDEFAWTSFPQQEFDLTLNYLDQKRSQIWIAPYGTISSYWRAQKILEALTPNATTSGTSYSWEVPGYFPNNINLKVKMKNGNGYQLVQNGQVIQPDTDGNYTISFDAKSLELKDSSYTVNYSNTYNLAESSDATIVPGNTGVASQKFVYNGSGWNGAFYTNDWSQHDISAFSTLEFWVKGDNGGEVVSMYVSDGTNGYSTNIQSPSDGSWQHVSINVDSMPGFDVTQWQTITFTSVTGPATFYINNVRFLP